MSDVLALHYMLKGKHIVLGISGGIAAYKSVMLLRLFVKAGAEVQVVITPNGKQFITPVTLSSLSGKPVISEFFTANPGEWHSHVDLGLWADAMVIAPATASTIAKMANGVADNMLITSYLSTRAKVFAAPAMDLDMWKHPSTQRNLAMLRADGVGIIEPEAGELASGLVGKGRMEEPEKIFEAVASYLTGNKPLAGKTYLVTAGPTYENIDPVRFIGNHSSGKMGFALAKALSDFGAKVRLVAGPVSLPTPEGEIERIDVVSAREMLAASESVFAECDGAIFCAAVADYAPAECAEKKIKREKRDSMTIELVKNPDISARLGQLKRSNQTLVGFALETDNETENATGKMMRKGLDWIALNSLRDAGAGFRTDTNKVTLIAADGRVSEIPLMAKSEVARRMVETIFCNADNQ